VSLDQKGNYRVASGPGKYVIDINRIGIDSSTDVPKETTVESGRTVKLDIQIDSGIQ
jgi:hypothetical protein